MKHFKNFEFIVIEYYLVIIRKIVVFILKIFLSISEKFRYQHIGLILVDNFISHIYDMLVNLKSTYVS